MDELRLHVPLRRWLNHRNDAAQRLANDYITTEDPSFGLQGGPLKMFPVIVQNFGARKYKARGVSFTQRHVLVEPSKWILEIHHLLADPNLNLNVRSMMVSWSLEGPVEFLRSLQDHS